MIDFPASPTDGQIFSATNGVVYKWSATYSSWLAQNPAPPLGGTGAVQAVSGTFNPVLNTDALITFLTVASGNEGGWYSTATGRYTPPAGRYFIQCTNGVQAPSGGNGTWSLIPRKNGVRIPNEGATASGAASFAVPITVGCYVDANGSDYFDWVANTNATGMTAQGGVFTAFPLTGMQGPTGGSPGPVVGDFFATGTGAVPTSVGVLVPAATIVGNSGGYFNAVTGRWTPPAGRYYLYSWLSMAAPSGGNVSGAVYLFKNGVQIPNVGVGGYQGTANAGFNTSASAMVDANGTDYFDVRGYASQAGTGYTLGFGAYPTQGMVGPQGPPGVISNGFRLLSRQVLGSAAPYLQGQPFPADINDIQFSFDVNCSLNGQDLVMQYFDNNGILDNTAGHYASAVAASYHTVPIGGNVTAVGSSTAGVTNSLLMTYSTASRRVWNGGGIRGRGGIPNVQGPGSKGFDCQNNYVSDDGTLLMAINANGYRGTAGAITGLRLVFGSGNMLAGSTLSVWGSP